MTIGPLLTHYLELPDEEFFKVVRNKMYEERATGDPETAAIIAALHLKLEECQRR